MIVSDKKKLNIFQQRSIPRNKDLFARVGAREIPMHEDGQVADFNGRLIDSLAGSISDFETQMLRDNQMPSDTDTSNSSDHDEQE